jgi:serine/threonine-protein kinase
MAEDGITEVGKYRILEQVGEGAMGVVYRALDPVLNRSVAIKVMTDALARDDDLRGRFLREAQAAGSLQHPNVITVYDFGEVDGHLYIAMEFVAGEDLEGVLARKAKLTLVQKIDILVDVLAGLGYAHKRGIVHRDIKPANIRIDEEGRARIMDFGIARLQSSKMTRTGLMVGTPAYMAPEQITAGAISPVTDLFSVGAVMYELLTGSKPFEGESLQSVFYKIVSSAPPAITTILPTLPASLNTIVMRALAKEPADRYASALDMANALTEARAGVDRESTQPKAVSLRSAIATGLSTRPTKKIPVYKKRPALIFGGGGAIVVLLAGGAYLLGIRSNANTIAASGAQPAKSTTPAVPPPAAPASQPVPNPSPSQPVANSTPASGATTSPSPTTSANPAAASANSRQSKTPAKSATAEPSAEELTLLRSLQASAADERRRASEAGATPDQLRAGDDHSAAAIAATRQGKIAEAANHLNQATTAWTNAERDARSASAAAAAKARVADASPPKRETPVIPPPAPVTQGATVTQPVAVQPPPVTTQGPPKVVANPSVEIESVVAAYARAIESRDVAEVRRAYPGATQAQLNGFEEFFKTVRSIRAGFSVGSLDVRGDAADARLTGAYDYVTNAGKTERQAVSFQASFRHDGGGWKLTSVR